MEGIFCTTTAAELPTQPPFFPLSPCSSDVETEAAEAATRTRQDIRPDAENMVAHIDGIRRTRGIFKQMHDVIPAGHGAGPSVVLT